MYRIGDVVSVNSDRGEVSKMHKGNGDWVGDVINVCLNTHIACIGPTQWPVPPA